MIDIIIMWLSRGSLSASLSLALGPNSYHTITRARFCNWQVSQHQLLRNHVRISSFLIDQCVRRGNMSVRTSVYRLLGKTRAARNVVPGWIRIQHFPHAWQAPHHKATAPLITYNIYTKCLFVSIYIFRPISCNVFFLFFFYYLFLIWKVVWMLWDKCLYQSVTVSWPR